MPKVVEISPEIGARIKEVREAEELSQVELGDLVGVAGATISRIEKGDRTTLPVLREICKALRKKPVDLLGFDLEAHRPQRGIRPELTRRLRELGEDGQERLLRALEEGLIRPKLAA